MTDRDAVALTIYGEARGEPFAGRLAVACVLRNRLRDGRWGHTYTLVCFAPKQFSCWNEADPNHALLLSLVGHHVTNAILSECYALADVLMHESIIAAVDDATHYYAPALADPAWAIGKTPVAVVGGHRFYEHIA